MIIDKLMRTKKVKKKLFTAPNSFPNFQGLISVAMENTMHA